MTVLATAGGGVGLEYNITSAQSIPSNQGITSPPPSLGSFLGQFGPSSSSHELSATQISASTN